MYPIDLEGKTEIDMDRDLDWFDDSAVMTVVENVLLGQERYKSTDMVCVYWRDGKSEVLPREGAIRTMAMLGAGTDVFGSMVKPAPEGCVFVILFDDVTRVCHLITMDVASIVLCEKNQIFPGGGDEA